MSDEIDIDLPVSRNELVRIKSVLWLCGETLKNLADAEPVGPQHASDIAEEVNKVLCKLAVLLHNSEKQVEEQRVVVANRRKAAEIRADMVDDWDRPQEFYFAIRQTEEPERSDEKPSYELYLCYRADWYENNERFPWKQLWLESEEVVSAVFFPEDGCEDSDSGVYWFSGDVEEHRRALLEAGFVEKPEIFRLEAITGVGEFDWENDA